MGFSLGEYSQYQPQPHVPSRKEMGPLYSSRSRESSSTLKIQLGFPGTQNLQSLYKNIQ